MALRVALRCTRAPAAPLPMAAAVAARPRKMPRAVDARCASSSVARKSVHLTPQKENTLLRGRPLWCLKAQKWDEVVMRWAPGSIPGRRRPRLRPMRWWTATGTFWEGAPCAPLLARTKPRGRCCHHKGQKLAMSPRQLPPRLGGGGPRLAGMHTLSRRVHCCKSPDGSKSRRARALGRPSGLPEGCARQLRPPACRMARSSASAAAAQTAAGRRAA